MSNIKISTSKAPAAIGPYSQGIKAGNTIYVSGQLPIDVSTGNFKSDDIKGQTKQSIENIKAILEEAGCSLNDVVKTTVYLKDINEFSDMNSVYAEYFNEPFPARACFEVAAIPKGAKVEIEAIAVK